MENNKPAELSPSQKMYLELEKIIVPRLLNDFCGYNEEAQGFDIVLATKEIIEAKEKECEELKKENKRLKKENQYHVNTYCHFKNELKKYKKAVHKYKIVLLNKIKQLYLSRREFLKEINSVPARIACKGEEFKNALNKFNNAIQVINNEDKYK